MPEQILPYHLVDNQVSTKNKILLTNIQLLSKQSYRDVSLDQIAKICEIKKQSVLYHFKSKQAMVLETIMLIKSYHERELQHQDNLEDVVNTLARLFFDEESGQVICRLAAYAHKEDPILNEPVQSYFIMMENILQKALHKFDKNLNAPTEAKLILAKFVGAITADGLNGNRHYSQVVLLSIKDKIAK